MSAVEPHQDDASKLSQRSNHENEATQEISPGADSFQGPEPGELDLNAAVPRSISNEDLGMNPPSLLVPSEQLHSIPETLSSSGRVALFELSNDQEPRPSITSIRTWPRNEKGTYLPS
jgi:hypothetical protein